VTGSLPEGVVTFLFTDIEGSTRLLTDIGDAAYGEALGAHRDIVSGAASAQGGVPFGSEGDAVSATKHLGGHRRGAARRSASLRSSGAWNPPAAFDVGTRRSGHPARRVAAAAHGGRHFTDATRVVAGEIGAGIAFLDSAAPPGDSPEPSAARGRGHGLESLRSRRSISRPTTCRPS
jgi:class 3 adenylate cyclase